MRKVTFESYSEDWKKEKAGIKNNIAVRWNEFGERFELLDKYMHKKLDELHIEIVNQWTGERFVRKIRDVTLYYMCFGVYFEYICVITWDDKEVED